MTRRATRKAASTGRLKHSELQRNEDAKGSARRLEFEAALLEPAQAALLFLVESAPAGPVITADEQQQEGNRKEVVRIDRKYDHGYEIGSNRDLDVGEPA